jgi:hypothetical protein
MNESPFEPSHNFLTLHEAEDVAVKLLGRIGAASQGYNKHELGNHYGRYFRVVAEGPGAFSYGQRFPLGLKHGDVVVANLQMRSEKLDVFNDRLSVIGSDHILARVVIDEEKKTMDLLAIQDCVLTIENDELHKRIAWGETTIHAPLEMLSKGQIASDLKQERKDPTAPGGMRAEQKAADFAVRAKFEQVLSVGPGKWMDGAFQELPYEAGDMVAFIPAATVTFVYGGGLTVRAVPYKAIRGRVARKHFAEPPDEMPPTVRTT